MNTATACIVVGTLLCSGVAQAADPALRLELGDRTRMTFQPKPVSPQAALPADLARAQPQAALGLEFASPAKKTGPRSLLRVQLSGDSVLNFRPRGGGLQVTYRSSF